MKKSRKFTNVWRLNNMLLKNQWVKRKIKKELKIPWDEKVKIYQNLWDAAKAVLRGKFIVINTYIKKEEKSQTT